MKETEINKELREDTSYIIVLNYNTGELLYHKCTPYEEEVISEDVENFLRYNNLNIDEVSYMFTKIKPTLKKF